MGTFIENLATLQCQNDNDASQYTVHLSKSVIKDFRYLKWALDEEENDDYEIHDWSEDGDEGDEEDEEEEELVEGEESKEANAVKDKFSAVGDLKEKTDPFNFDVLSLSLPGNEEEAKSPDTTRPFPPISSAPEKKGESDLEVKSLASTADVDQDRHRDTDEGDDSSMNDPEVAMMIKMGLPVGFRGDNVRKESKTEISEQKSKRRAEDERRKVEEDPDNTGDDVHAESVSSHDDTEDPILSDSSQMLSKLPLMSLISDKRHGGRDDDDDESADEDDHDETDEKEDGACEDENERGAGNNSFRHRGNVDEKTGRGRDLVSQEDIISREANPEPLPTQKVEQSPVEETFPGYYISLFTRTI